LKVAVPVRVGESKKDISADDPSVKFRTPLDTFEPVIQMGVAALLAGKSQTGPGVPL